MTPRTIGEIDTPAIVVDVNVMQQNLARVGDYARTHNLRLRPHTKTHKIPELGRLQLQSGAVGLTVAKTTEAEVMLAAEPEDLLVAYPVIGREKTRRAAELAGRTRLTVAVDSAPAAAGLSEAAVEAKSTIGILIEIDPSGQ